ncbi:hypothetical protein RJ639_012445 [Escallonia herrerae]|uniref:DC1 domain-containing protein n=1 Tax=Escallonia herrerae TaxID=1293975 RepID=A0AA88VJS3_9ASTE|nr:hypothetical protein RJ639_012445 [Escallonia herrerae]
MEYKHFSHRHNLNIHQVQQGQQLLCSGCESFCHGSVYACWQCNFFLHSHCGNATRYMKHPSHPSHPLILIPQPTYCSGSFLCNACDQSGSSFSYCCALCEVDLHVHCAFLPPEVSHKVHPHELSLTYSALEKKGAPQFCKICSKSLESKHWTYGCTKCDFGVHTFCATTEVKPGLYQMEDSADGATPEGYPGLRQDVCEAKEDQIEVELSEEALVQLYKLQLQMQMAEQVAQVMASMNLS